MKIFRKVLLVIGGFFFGFLLCFNIYQFVCTQILGQSLATLNGYAVLEVVSGSMEPTIHVGDLIIIDTKESEIKENDIVTFTDIDGSFVTHRVISIKDDQMVTRGDNNNSNDPVSSLDTVVGKYLFKLSGLGILLSSLKNPFVMFMIFVVGLLICYYLSLDHDGKMLLTEEEKEYQEFLEYQKEQQLKSDSPFPDLTKEENVSKSKKEKKEELLTDIDKKKANLNTKTSTRSTKRNIEDKKTVNLDKETKKTSKKSLDSAPTKEVKKKNSSNTSKKGSQNKQAEKKQVRKATSSVSAKKPVTSKKKTTSVSATTKKKKTEVKKTTVNRKSEVKKNDTKKKSGKE
jgi:signal peptidase I